MYWYIVFLASGEYEWEGKNVMAFYYPFALI